MSDTRKEMTLPAEVERLPEVLSFLEETLEVAECPMKTMMQISVAAEEVFVNIASYAYAPGKGETQVCVEILDAPRRVVMTFSDGGVPFDPLKKADPDVTLSAEERNIGGLGIYMAKKAMDEVRYEYKNGQNVLTLMKNI